ncbi:MAG: YhcH/YjgK/YiaL family protein [Pirellulales bacterium]|nr:YhcH/YjgK/YiaL family protein [Pirellulales bacterium]
MILDRLENAAPYRGYHQRVAKAFDYLAKTDLLALPAGKYELDGDRLYAMVQRSRTRRLDEIVWEAHRKYIDVQYVAAGAERMGYVALDETLKVAKPYSEEGDAVLLEAHGSFFDVRAGSFVVFGPKDVHAPGLAVDDLPSDVVKIVVKCRID